MPHGVDCPVLQPHHGFRFCSGGKVIGSPGQMGVQRLCPTRDAEILRRIVLMGEPTERMDPLQLIRQLITDGHKLVMQPIILHAFEDLMESVEPSDIPVMRLTPQSPAELLLQAFGTAFEGEQLHSACQSTCRPPIPKARVDPGKAANSISAHPVAYSSCLEFSVLSAGHSVEEQWQSGRMHRT